jgi:hypothetical protein
MGVLVYLDDILIHTPTLSDHESNIRKVFDRLRKHNIKLKPEKSIFFGKQVNYLGHVISASGIKADPKKTEVVQNFPRPTKIVEIQSFLGMANYYRRYIRNFSETAKPLYSLCKKDVEYKWSNECETAFITLKEKLTTSPVLIHPCFTEQFILTCDASNYCIAGVLSQGKLPHDRPIHFASRLLRKSELNYSTIEKELLAIIFSVNIFRHYLYASAVEFLVVTDHQPLVYLMNLKNVSSRLYRWKLALMEFQFKVVHRKGTLNRVADCLSRIPQPEAKILCAKFINNQNPSTLRELLTLHLKKKDIQNFYSPNAMQIRKVTTRAEHKQLQEKKLENQLNSMELISPNVQLPINNKNKITNKKIPKLYYDNPEIGTKPNPMCEIIERNTIQIDLGDFLHIFYLFPSSNCELRKAVERRLKTKINLPKEMNPYQAYSIDKDRTAFVLPNVFRSTEQLEKANMIIKEIQKISELNEYDYIYCIKS